MSTSVPPLAADRSSLGTSEAASQLPQLWGRRGFWQIRARWAVAPLMIASVAIGRALGFEFETVPILLIALASLVYNAFFAWIYSHFENQLAADPKLDRFFTLLEVIVDYAAMFLLIHFTGGVSSPLVPFLLFHVIIAAVQFSASTAYSLASVAAGGLWLILLGETLEWIPCHGIHFQGQSIHFMDRPIYAAAWLIFFTATLFLAAAMVSRIMNRFRQGVEELTHTTAELAILNKKLSGLYAMVGAIGAERHLQPILDTVTAEITKVMNVRAATIKLLSDDGNTLKYVASQGLPEDLVAKTAIQLDKSPLNRRVVEGETLVKDVDQGDEHLHLHEVLSDLGIRSAAFAPLAVENRVIGTMGIYARRPNRFDTSDTEFLELAAKLVAIAIEDARVNEAIETLMAERTQFMLQVAHNLRAPLSAGLSMMELLQDGYMGTVTDQQKEYLQRIESRLGSLDQTIGELLTIARARDWSHEIPDVVVDLDGLAAYTERLFSDDAASRGIAFTVTIEEDLPQIDSGTELLEQVMENLVSNAIKYTPEGGSVNVHFGRQEADTIEIRVEDTGIGIPVNEQEKLFQEFFRASNAKRHTTTGTGLGLALVKQTVERHKGDVQINSTEGEGTEVIVRLPIHQVDSALS